MLSKLVDLVKSSTEKKGYLAAAGFVVFALVYLYSGDVTTAGHYFLLALTAAGLHDLPSLPSDTVAK